MDDTPKVGIRNEIVYTVLVNNHHVQGRPVPVTLGTHKTSYELDNGFVGKVGVGYQYKHAKVTLAYRFLSVREHYELWAVARRERGGGYWQESHGRDLSAFELGVWYEF